MKNQTNHHSIPVHEQLLMGMILAMAAGSLDAYTYLVHGEVFAGLQTGNLILLGIHLANANLALVLRYLIPILAFMLGTIITRSFQLFYHPQKIKFPRQMLVLMFEILIMLMVAFFGNIFSNTTAASLLSIVAAAQLQEFSRLEGRPFTSIMMTGNVRGVAEAFFDGSVRQNRSRILKGTHTLLVVLAFIMGAVLSGLFVPLLGNVTILVTAVILLIGVFTLFRQ